MRVLILGGGGMLGHKIYQVLSEDFNVKVTFRSFNDKLKNTGIFKEDDILAGIEAKDLSAIEKIIENYKPELVINCIGIIKQLREAKNPKLSIYTNSLFPHLLADICTINKIKLIHISTDCVFSGNKGNYTESDNPDPIDLYGRSKLLGEIDYGNSLTIRTSIIGHELNSNISLIEWFLSQNQKKIKGFTNAIYSGFPTIIFANEIVRIIKEYPDLKGIYNISSDPISKYELLQLVKSIYKLDIEIEPYDDFYCDRSLNSSKYRQSTNFQPMHWQNMIEIMHKDYLMNYKSKGIK